MSNQKVTIRQESSPTVKEKREDEDGEVEGVIVEGLALPFKRESRNGVVYQKESIKERHETMEGNSVLFNHDDSIMSYGHVEETVILEGEEAPADDGMYYRVNLDPNEEKLINKVERGDINSVSIQAFVDESEAEDNVVPVTEFLELSFVNIAGFPQTTTQAQDSPSPASAWGTPEGVLAERLGIEQESEVDEEDSREEELVGLVMEEKGIEEEEAREWLEEAEERYSNKKESEEDSDRTDNMGEEDDNSDGSQTEQPEDLKETLEEIQESLGTLEERVESLEDRLESDDEEDDEEPEGDEEEGGSDEDDGDSDGSSKQSIEGDNKNYHREFREQVKNGLREGKDSEDE